jgi:sugar O-acyltransferase (sialic acid O-acetyltransferase NeuD family)
MQVYVVCAGGHAKQVIDVFLSNKYEVLGAFDDHKVGHFYRGVNIVGKLDNLAFRQTGMCVGTPVQYFCTVGDNQLRKQITDKYKALPWTNCISPYAYISPTVTMGQGNYIGVHARLLSDVSIGSFNIINDGATLTHDNTISHFNHIAPNASLGGRVVLGSFNLVGANATLNPDVHMTDRITIGSGCVVLKNVYEEGVYVGVPCKKIVKTGGNPHSPP